jgi:hypothetical protein
MAAPALKMTGPIPRYSNTSSYNLPTPTPTPSQRDYTHIVRTKSPKVPLTSAQIHFYFKAYRKIPTRRDSGLPLHQHTEFAALVAAHKHALTLESSASDFRDALVDATAEYLDDHGLAHFPWTDLYADASGSPNMLLGLVCLYWTFTDDPMVALGPRMASEEAEERFLKARRLLRANEKTGREMWEEYMKDGRCTFHEHEDEECWWDRLRGGEADAEEMTVQDEQEDWGDETVHEEEYEDTDATIEGEVENQDRDGQQRGKRDSKCEEYRIPWK